MDFFLGAELKRVRRILLNRHTGLYLALIPDNSGRLSIALLRCLSFFSFHTASPHARIHPYLFLLVHEIIHIFFILDMPGPFVIPDALNVLNLRQVLVIVFKGPCNLFCPRRQGVPVFMATAQTSQAVSEGGTCVSREAPSESIIILLCNTFKLWLPKRRYAAYQHLQCCCFLFTFF